MQMDPRRWHVTTTMDAVAASGASIGNLSGDIHLGEAQLIFSKLHHELSCKMDVPFLGPVSKQVLPVNYVGKWFYF